MAEFLMGFPKWQWLATAAAFLLFAGFEALRPRRSAGAGRWKVWIVNLSLYASGAVLVVLLAPLVMQGATWIQGVLGFPPLVGLGMPAWLLVVVSFLLIDLIAYLEHAGFHAVPALWRMHQVHHSDPELDASTGVRHHPLESLIGAFLQLALFAVLGLPILVILAYAAVMTVWQFFTHSNLSLPEPLDRLARVLVVTPGMHIVHHSVQADEGNSNFGMVLSIWDRLFGTYRRRPAPERLTMELGLLGRAERQAFGRLLLSPLRR